MNPDTIATTATTALALLSPYLAEGGKEFAKIAAKNLWVFLKQKLKGKKEEQQLIEFEKNPTNEREIKEFTKVLERLMQENETLKNELEQRINEVTIINNIGKIKVEKNTFKNKGNVIIERQKITNIFLSLDYTALIKEIKDIAEILAAIPSDKIELIAKQNEKLEKLKNIGRLGIAKALFNEGKFKEADAALNATEMEQELEDLIRREAKVDSEKSTIQQNRQNKANEYIIKAQTTFINFDTPNRFTQTCHYYEQALRSQENLYTLNTYAVFLYHNNQFDKALSYYEKILKYDETQLDKAKKAGILNNIGILYSDNNRMDAALLAYEEALAIRRKLSKTQPQAYLPDVAMTLINLGIFYQEKIPNKEKSLTAVTEAIFILLPLLEKIPFAQQYFQAAITVLKAWEIDPEQYIMEQRNQLQKESGNEAKNGD